TRYRRFFSPLSNLTDPQWRYLTEIDQDDHVAWGIVPLDRPDLIGVGVGRFITLEEDPHTAEFALLIRDEMQGEGYGTLLLAVLYWLAKQKGLKKLRGIVQPDNLVVQDWTRRLGGHPHLNDEGHYVVDIPLQGEIEDQSSHFFVLLNRLERGEVGPPDSESSEQPA
ncbi:MAG: GNAT family N-acetyltransferase, partial [Chloroflexota bacterium]